jgi:hypothetical protein
MMTAKGIPSSDALSEGLNLPERESLEMTLDSPVGK